MAIDSRRAGHSGVHRLTAGATSLGFGLLGWVGAHQLTDRVAGHTHLDGHGGMLHHAHGYTLPMIAAALGMWLVGLVTVLRLRPTDGTSTGVPVQRPSRRTPLAAISLPTAGFVLEEATRAVTERGGHAHGALYLAIGLTTQALAGAVSWHLGQACLGYVRRLAPPGPALFVAVISRLAWPPAPNGSPRSGHRSRHQGRAPPAAVL